MFYLFYLSGLFDVFKILSVIIEWYCYFSSGRRFCDHHGQYSNICSSFFSETFSFVLTDMMGERHFGYCRQIQVCPKKHCYQLLKLKRQDTEVS